MTPKYRLVREVALACLLFLIMLALWPAQSVPNPDAGETTSTPSPSAHSGAPSEPAGSEDQADPSVSPAPLATKGLQPSLMVPTVPTPTTEPSALTVGVASWYPAPEGHASAPFGHWHMNPVAVRVWRGDKYVTVEVIGFCQCYVGTDDERIIDLSRTDFAKLGDPILEGTIDVELEWLE